MSMRSERLNRSYRLVKENDATDLAAALQRMLESVELRRKFGEAGRVFAMERYSDTAVASAYLAAFHDLAARRRN